MGRGQKWTSGVNGRENIYGIIYGFFLNQGIMFLKCLYLRNSIILYSVHWYRYNYVHIKQLYMWVTRVQFNVQCECCK